MVTLELSPADCDLSTATGVRTSVIGPTPGGTTQQPPGQPWGTTVGHNCGAAMGGELL